MTELAELELGGDGAGTELAELELGSETEPELSDGADLELDDESDLELGGGVETKLAELEQGGDGAATELAELEPAGEAEPELGGGHLTGLLDHPSTELLRVGEGLALAVVPRTQSSRCSCLPPTLSSVWRRRS